MNKVDWVVAPSTTVAFALRLKGSYQQALQDTFRVSVGTTLPEEPHVVLWCGTTRDHLYMPGWYIEFVLEEYPNLDKKPLHLYGHAETAKLTYVYFDGGVQLAEYCRMLHRLMRRYARSFVSADEFRPFLLLRQGGCSALHSSVLADDVRTPSGLMFGTYGSRFCPGVYTNQQGRVLHAPSF